MKLDTNYLSFISKDEIRVLTAIEMGMKNHEYVPMILIERISRNKRANAFKIIKQLIRNKLVEHVNNKYDGYRLTYMGYDYLALQVLQKRGVFDKLISRIGVGKESDIYKCSDQSGNIVILKLMRLGRISFRTVKKNRDYLKNRTQFNWLYLSRLSAQKEYEFMLNLHKNGFAIPRPIDSNRHAIIMEIIDGFNLNQLVSLEEQQVQSIFQQCVNNLIKFLQYGLIHCDFNEFNIMLLTNQTKILVIDFPQMVSRNHKDAKFYFYRDQQCINDFFHKRFKYDQQVNIDFDSVPHIYQLDLLLKTSGYNHDSINYNLINNQSEYLQLDQYLQEKRQINPQEFNQLQFNSDEENEEDQSDDNDEENNSQNKNLDDQENQLEEEELNKNNSNEVEDINNDKELDINQLKKDFQNQLNYLKKIDGHQDEDEEGEYDDRDGDDYNFNLDVDIDQNKNQIKIYEQQLYNENYDEQQQVQQQLQFVDLKQINKFYKNKKQQEIIDQQKYIKNFVNQKNAQKKHVKKNHNKGKITNAMDHYY